MPSRGDKIAAEILDDILEKPTWVQAKVEEIVHRAELSGPAVVEIKKLMEAVGIATAIECKNVVLREGGSPVVAEAVMLVGGKRSWQWSK